MENTRSADFCADQIAVITNFGVITNVVMKRFHCICLSASTVDNIQATFKLEITCISYPWYNDLKATVITNTSPVL